MELASFRKFRVKHSHDTLGWEWTDFSNTYNRRKCRANMEERKSREREYVNELGLYKYTMLVKDYIKEGRYV